MVQDFFAQKAQDYDSAARRVGIVERIAGAIRARVPLDDTLRLADFGAGTGLLLERLAPSVASFAAIDVSPAMIARLEHKRAELGCELEVLPVDLTRTRIDRRFDGVVSSMTLHHIRDVDAIFRTLRMLIVPGGFLALADLDTEDGSFHEEDTGVHHHGFDRDALAAIAAAAGFRDVAIDDAGSISKSGRDYPVFLLTARVPEDADA